MRHSQQKCTSSVHPHWLTGWLRGTNGRWSIAVGAVANVDHRRGGRRRTRRGRSHDLDIVVGAVHARTVRSLGTARSSARRGDGRVEWAAARRRSAVVRVSRSIELGLENATPFESTALGPPHRSSLPRRAGSAVRVQTRHRQPNRPSVCSTRHRSRSLTQPASQQRHGIMVRFRPARAIADDAQSLSSKLSLKDVDVKGKRVLIRCVSSVTAPLIAQRRLQRPP